MCDDKYEGWTNRETWAAALHINNDQGWQESVHEALRALVDDNPDPDDEVAGVTAGEAGQVIKDNVEETLSMLLVNVGHDPTLRRAREYESIRDDLGSLWRVDWDELGAAFLRDLEEQ